MRKELLDLLISYLAVWRTVRDCAEWLTSIDWDDPELDQENRTQVARFELLSTEVLEGLRSEREFAKEATEFVAEVTGSLYVVWEIAPQTVAASSTNTMETPELIVTEPGPSLPWNISPRPVSV